MPTLNDFLRTCTIKKDDKETKPTHTRIGNKDCGIYGGSFHIPDEKKKEFYHYYYTEIIYGNGTEYLTEKQNIDGKFYVDLDFRYCYDDVSTRQHTKEDINIIVGTYADIMKEYVQFNEPFDVYVMEKDNVNQLEDKTLTKDGIHILFDVEIPRPLHSSIRKKMIEKCSSGLIELPLLNSWDSVFDEGISKGTTNCQLFGSKKPLHDSYKLTYIFNMELDHNDNEFMMIEQHDKTMTKELFLKLLVSEKGKQFTIKNKGNDVINMINNTKKETKPKQATNTIITNQVIVSDNEPTTEIYSWFKKGLEYNIFDKMIKKCDGDLGRQVWFRLAFLLKDDVGELGEDLFVDLSRTHTKFDEDDVRKKYKKLCEYPKPDKLLTIATLKKLYKEVDNEAYELINNYFKSLKKQQKDLQKGLQKGELHETLKKQLEDKLIELQEEAGKYEFDTAKLDRFNTDYFMTLGSYALKKKYFEKFVCKVLRPDAVYIYCETETNLSNDLCIYSQNKISETFKHLNFIDYVEKGDNIVEVKKSFIMEWLEDEHILCYNKMDFIPYNENKPITDNIFNTFRGFNPLCKTKYDATKKEALLKPFKDLWLHLCGGEQKNFDYFYKFIAQMFQEPNKRVPIAFIIKGKQGTGKNVGLAAIGNVLGRHHYKSSCNPKDFFGEYAEGFVNQLLVNMNECEGKDTFDFEGKIKSFISEDYITLNQKYLRPITIANLARTIIFTNKQNPIPIDVRSKERRFVVYQTTDFFLDKKYGTLFWTKLMNHFNRPDFIACLYDDLMNIDIEKMDWKGARPITQAYMDMCKLYVPVEVLFFEDYCVNHKIQPQFLCSNVYNDNIDCVDTGSEFYKLFNEFCNKYKFNRTGERNIKSFYNRIIELELPLKTSIPHNIKTFHFNTFELLTFFKQKAWIDRSDDDVIDVSQDNSGETFDDLFNI